MKTKHLEHPQALITIREKNQSSGKSKETNRIHMLSPLVYVSVDEF